MFVFNDFSGLLRRADMRQNVRAQDIAHICATKLSGTKSLNTNIGTIPKNMPNNFELKPEASKNLKIECMN